MPVVAESGRAGEIALYTGNDDSIVTDLLTAYSVRTASGVAKLRIVGGLLGHWACWTRAAVELLAGCQATWNSGTVPAELLTRAAEVTDCNAAFFDAANGFAGCLPGIHEVLRRQGLMSNALCLNPSEQLSPGQLEEIDRVHGAYPHLNDDAFVEANLGRWLDGRYRVETPDTDLEEDSQPDEPTGPPKPAVPSAARDREEA